MSVLETEHFVLREFDQNDLRDIAAWEQLSDGQSPEERAREFLDYCFREYRDRGIGPWGIESKATKAVVGNCGFPHIAIRDQCGEVNCYIAPQYRGRGFATEALKALFEFGFRDLCLHRIQARCELTNLISQSLAQKAGMRFEGFIEDPSSPTVSCAKQKMFVILSKEFHIVRASQPPVGTSLAPTSESRR